MNDLFKISATSSTGAPFVTSAPNPAAAYAAARMFADEGYINPAKPIEWQLVPNFGLIVECFVRIDDGPTHLVCWPLEPGQRVTTTPRNRAGAATLGASPATRSEVTHRPAAHVASPARVCHTTWAARFDQLNAPHRRRWSA
ncbi:hypothetical protein [Saccharopolyspora pogona]|uniref:hypothetical protein n=1 Tax=Saccharopolyspora pogona TaxID=333966 RepID=UPI0016855B33|nr:hypothetical protein [Saccharopolyspora pogona]